jgi:hypothetical protein
MREELGGGLAEKFGGLKGGEWRKEGMNEEEVRLRKD